MPEEDKPEVVAARLFEDNKQQQGMLVLTLAQFESEVDAKGWDQPPWLYVFYRQLPPTDLADQLRDVGLVGQAMAVQPIGALPNTTREEMAVAMALLARQIERGTIFAPPLGPDLLAWVLVSEGWAAIPADTDESREQLLTDAAEHRIAERADRIETRSVLAVDRALVRYDLLHFRDGEVWVAVDEQEETILGELVKGLVKLIEATP